ncbi:unnamed protein product, partial [Trichogramma brassicae]
CCLQCCLLMANDYNELLSSATTFGSAAGDVGVLRVLAVVVQAGGCVVSGVPESTRLARCRQAVSSVGGYNGHRFSRFLEEARILARGSFNAVVTQEKINVIEHLTHCSDYFAMCTGMKRIAALASISTCALMRMTSKYASGAQLTTFLLISNNRRNASKVGAPRVLGDHKEIFRTFGDPDLKSSPYLNQKRDANPTELAESHSFCRIRDIFDPSTRTTRVVRSVNQVNQGCDCLQKITTTSRESSPCPDPYLEPIQNTAPIESLRMQRCAPIHCSAHALQHLSEKFCQVPFFTSPNLFINYQREHQSIVKYVVSFCLIVNWTWWQPKARYKMNCSYLYISQNFTQHHIRLVHHPFENSCMDFLVDQLRGIDADRRLILRGSSMETAWKSDQSLLSILCPTAPRLLIISTDVSNWKVINSHHRLKVQSASFVQEKILVSTSLKDDINQNRLKYHQFITLSSSRFAAVLHLDRFIFEKNCVNVHVDYHADSTWIIQGFLEGRTLISRGSNMKLIQ